MGGLMGGEATGCDATTTSVFVECALFDPVRVAQTGRRHQIVSDARQRFERGIDVALMPDAVEAATAMVLELCGGEPGPIAEAGAMPDWRRDATMRFDRIAEFGGSAISPDEAVNSLQRLGFVSSHREAARSLVAVPSWRNDMAARSTCARNAVRDGRQGAEGCARSNRNATSSKRCCACAVSTRSLRIIAARIAGPAATLNRSRPAPRRQRTLAARPRRVRHLQLHGAAEAELFGDTPKHYA